MTKRLTELQKVANKLAKNCADTLDARVRDVLLYGNSVGLVNPTPWYMFNLVIKRKIKSLRLSIAEWIGGDELHENCDY